MQQRLVKLDVFKGEIGEKLDDFIYQLEEFATFHEWDLTETCRQARTHLRGVGVGLHHTNPSTPAGLGRIEDFADSTIPALRPNSSV